MSNINSLILELNKAEEYIKNNPVDNPFVSEYRASHTKKEFGKQIPVFRKRQELVKKLLNSGSIRSYDQYSKGINDGTNALIAKHNIPVYTTDDPNDTRSVEQMKNLINAPKEELNGVDIASTAGIKNGTVGAAGFMFPNRPDLSGVYIPNTRSLVQDDTVGHGRDSTSVTPVLRRHEIDEWRAGLDPDNTHMTTNFGSEGANHKAPIVIQREHPLNTYLSQVYQPKNPAENIPENYRQVQQNLGVYSPYILNMTKQQFNDIGDFQGRTVIDHYRNDPRYADMFTPDQWEAGVKTAPVSLNPIDPSKWDGRIVSMDNGYNGPTPSYQPPNINTKVKQVMS